MLRIGKIYLVKKKIDELAESHKQSLKNRKERKKMQSLKEKNSAKRNKRCTLFKKLRDENFYKKKHIYD